MLYCRRGDDMPRQKSGNFDQNKYVGKYIHERVVYRRMNLNLDKIEDRVLAAWVDLQGNTSAYLRRLVETDMYNASLTTDGMKELEQAKILAETDPKYKPRQ